MTNNTFNKLLVTLIDEIATHPNREELLQLMEDQLVDDTNFIQPVHY